MATLYIEGNAAAKLLRTTASSQRTSFGCWSGTSLKITVREHKTLLDPKCRIPTVPRETLRSTNLTKILMKVSMKTVNANTHPEPLKAAAGNGVKRAHTPRVTHPCALLVAYVRSRFINSKPMSVHNP